ncbi:hypothetical protein GWK47_040285 [Chionoecetes opilio]|uniref:Uncharacterized protein n=1 Tax=Chionoecetes opilio TaxID=41210 RepID=A0A8J5D003_CHIOP|nr:hypothetical protein GWK47_040285 [Chionoecetes opilio]
MAKAIYVLKIRMFRSHVENDNAEGKGLEESLSSSFSSTRARGWRRGWRPKLRTTTSNLVKDLHHFQEINGAIGKTTSPQIFPPSLVPRRRLVGCLFLGEDQHGGKKKIAEETRKGKGPRPNPVQTRLRIKLINPRSPTHLQRLCSRGSPSSHRHLLSLFPPCGRGEANPAYQKGVSPVKNLQRHKRRGRAWGGDDFIVQNDPPNQG